MGKPTTPPPSFRIQLLHERKSGAHRKIDGLCGARYVFTYDEKLKHYVYTPKTEAEASDIFATVGRTSLSAFSPVSLPSVGPATKEEAVAYLLKNPEIAATVLADYRKAIAPEFTPASVEQIEECIVRGIVISEDDSTEVVQRLIDVTRKTERQAEACGIQKGRAEAFVEVADVKPGAVDEPPTLTPAQKRAATMAAKKAAQSGETKESTDA